MAAARALWPYGCATYCFATHEENEAAKLRDWEVKARLIDRETGAGELAGALAPLAALWLPEDADPELAQDCAERDEFTLKRSDIRRARAVLARSPSSP